MNRFIITTTNFKRKYPNVTSYRDALQQVLERDLSKIKNKKVLEIGCGKWDFAKKVLEKNNCSWYGLEPVDLGGNNLTFIKGSVKNMPFHNNSFDVVLCNQTIEHWFEYGVSFKKALREINRVLKYNGILMINTGIHIHGHPFFLRGSLKKIKRLFEKNKWKIILFEKGIPYEKIKRWKQISSKGWQSKLSYPDFLIPNSKNAFSYLLNIHTVNLKKIKKEKVNNHYLRPMKVIIRFFKELMFGIL